MNMNKQMKHEPEPVGVKKEAAYVEGLMYGLRSGNVDTCGAMRLKTKA